ncbi:hypothetical protein TSUD_244370 [Trifolium subterraneum]|uniref:Reverse transcriptase zinc-binding domain-containing protein n=1 Tax=Trifolium subterraneum TaxID=3900 RepID=A0A2Z6NS41_TRISU|nr:hypothetical protein TSUD_244370 [Trifolium subterraneum]
MRREVNTLAHPDKSFKSALAGEMSAPVLIQPEETQTVAADIPMLETDVEEEFLQTLIGSYVGRLRKVVETKNLQMKLGRAGLQVVKVLEMGANMVLLSRGPEVGVGEPVCNLQWWEGFLEELKPWSPNQVCSSRRLWVRVYGVPLHAWGERTFRSISNRCVELVRLDLETANRSRFDVARIQIDTALQGFIDFVIKLKVQGAVYKVRVVEENDGPKELEGAYLEDQLRWSTAASSCASGGGGGQAHTVLEGLDDDNSDCGASEECQYQGRESTVGEGFLENDTAMSLGGTEIRLDIPSNVEKVMVTEETFVQREPNEARGSKSDDKVDQGDKQVADPHIEDAVNIPHSFQPSGPGVVRNLGCHSKIPLVGLEEPIFEVSPSVSISPKIGCEGPVNNISLIEKFDQVLSKSRGKQGALVLSDLSDQEPIHTTPIGLLIPSSSTPAPIKHRKPHLRIPFPPMMGPKSMRLMGAINGGSLSTRRRRDAKKGGEAKELTVGPSFSVVSGGDQHSGWVDPEGQFSDSDESYRSIPGIDLEVVLPAATVNPGQSGVRDLMDEHTILHVEGFQAARQDPAYRAREAEKLIEIQQAIGVSFDSNEHAPMELPENGEAFTVNSTFFLVSDVVSPLLYEPPWRASAFTVIWKCPSPSKVSAFGWQLLHDRIPTRSNLQHRKIIDANGDNSCALCGGTTESSLHLFIYCDAAMTVWKAVFDWLKLPFSLPHNLFSILNFFSHSRGKKLRKGLTTIWNAVVWSLWRQRNAVIFDNGTRDDAEVIDGIKVLSWKWWLSQSKVSHSLLYEWQMEPTMCMAR